MKDVQQLLAEKETEMARLQKEIHSLQMILPLLAEDALTAGSVPEATQSAERKPPENVSPRILESQGTGTEGAPQLEHESGLWGFAKRWREK